MGGGLGSLSGPPEHYPAYLSAVPHRVMRWDKRQPLPKCSGGVRKTPRSHVHTRVSMCVRAQRHVCLGFLGEQQLTFPARLSLLLCTIAWPQSPSSRKHQLPFPEPSFLCTGHGARLRACALTQSDPEPPVAAE